MNYESRMKLLLTLFCKNLIKAVVSCCHFARQQQDEIILELTFVLTPLEACHLEMTADTKGVGLLTGLTCTYDLTYIRSLFQFRRRFNRVGTPTILFVGADVKQLTLPFRA